MDYKFFWSLKEGIVPDDPMDFVPCFPREVYSYQWRIFFNLHGKMFSISQWLL